MHQRKSKQVLIYLFLYLLLGSITNINFQNTKILNLNHIEVLGLDDKGNRELANKIENLKSKNIFFLNKNHLKNIIEINTLIENYKIFKIYPSTLDIKINKTKSLAKINQNGKILFIGSNGKLSEIVSHEQELPFIFGKPKIQEFLEFKKIIDNSKISYENIKSLFFFRTKRWDIELKNNILIKLSRDNVEKDLNNVYLFLDKENDSSKKIIDARIQNQIITNE